MNAIDIINQRSLQYAIDAKKEKDGEAYSENPDFAPGDIINVALRVVEGEKERIQNFRGIVLGKRGGGVNETFLIRKVSNGVGVERIFPLFSPMIQSITVVKKGNVRRAKLYYLRGMSEKKIRAKIS